MKKQIFIPNILKYVLLLLVFTNCQTTVADELKLADFSKNQLNIWNEKLTDAMVQDIFSPPVASRIYAYPNIAAYEVMVQATPQHTSLNKSIKHLEKIPNLITEKDYYLPLSAIIAFSEVAQALVYSYEKLATAQEEDIATIRALGVKEKTIQNSIEHGKAVAQHILKWVAEDGYKSRNNYSQIISDRGAGTWRPTPPDFLEPIEPNWQVIRPFLLDSASQFRPAPPTEFALAKNSKFYQECMEVYESVKKANTEQVNIAKFWDCNPNASHHTGHMMTFQQKISPGAHWVLIASAATKKIDLSLIERAKVFAALSIVLADGFISCWSEKYKTVVIRPETYINEYIDKNWKPILQTPAFPEYTSGHSVASAASATILTQLIGADFAFIDSTEVAYGLPTRSFVSFNQAAEEAAISRLYGGIHYMPAITNGVQQGRNVGNYIADKLNINSDNDGD